MEGINQLVSIGHIDLASDEIKGTPDYDSLPLLATRNLVLFPGVALPIAMVRPDSLRIAREASENHIPVGIICQKHPEDKHLDSIDQVWPYGVVADVFKVIELPAGPPMALVKARNRFKVVGAAEPATALPALHAKVMPLQDVLGKAKDPEFDVLIASILELSKEITKKTDAFEMMSAQVEGVLTPAEQINHIASMMPFDAEEKIKMLAQRSVKKRAMELFASLERMMQKLEITDSLKERAKADMDRQARNAFLQSQYNAIREELYGDEAEEVVALRHRLEETHLPEAADKTVAKEIDKLARMNPATPDYATSLAYLETVLDLPWNTFTDLNTDFALAEETMNRDHYGLEKVKDRILEQLAVMLNNPGGKAPILCLVGAPGVGKTSLGQSIAKALGRKYERISLGGLHDESEIRGHRRTYIGAMPGRIIDAMKRAGTRNPVILLDEVDKIGADYKGDPSAALLEVLDPEQNCRFHDNYVDVDFDLSDVLFIATANTLQTLSRPLLDRMEIIEISGYLPEEKMEIARRHLIPRICQRHNISEQQMAISDAALRMVVEEYTAESGVRQLEKALSTIARKCILNHMRHKDNPAEIQPSDLKAFLGLPIHHSDRWETNEFAGVVTGLAWTQVGGEILFVESSLSQGKDAKLTLTGNLGDVMKESAVIALEYVKSHAAEFGIDPEAFATHALHIHVPEGAIPKDGPSAGITMATSIVSTFTRRKVRARMAMTGEITLRGKVLPVGGIKEKILAAKRAGITDIVLSSDNRRDVEDINARYVEGLTFHYVDNVAQVIAIAVTDELASA